MTNSIDDITSEAKAFFITGSNTTETHPVIGYRIRRAIKNGAKLIVADPRRIKIAEHADVFLQLKPGTNAALLQGMAKVILDEKLYDEDFIKNRTEGFEEYPEKISGIDLNEMAEITGVPAEKIAEAARIYAGSDPAAILYTMGITQHTSGTDNVLALAGLATLTGNLGKRGGGVNPLRGQNNVQGACDTGALPNVFPGYQPVSSPEANKKFSEAYGAEIPDKPGMPMTKVFSAALEDKIKGVYVMGENPAVSEPDICKITEALSKLELVVVQDLFFTETADYADVVLPAASFAEKDGTFVNTERRVQLGRKAINPPGDAKSDFEILSKLGQKLGLKGFDYSDASEVMKEIGELNPKWKGITYERLEEGGLCWPCLDENHPGTPILYGEKFLTGSSKAQFKPVDYKPPAETPDDEYPFILTTGRSLYHYHTGTMTRRSEGLSDLYEMEKALISKEDAARLGLSENDKVRLSSRRGEVEAEVKPVSDLKEGTVFMTFHFAETCANQLTNSELDPVASIPELKVCTVNVEKV